MNSQGQVRALVLPCGVELGDGRDRLVPILLAASHLVDSNFVRSTCSIGRGLETLSDGLSQRSAGAHPVMVELAAVLIPRPGPPLCGLWYCFRDRIWP